MDGLRIIFRIIGIVIALVGVLAAAYHFITKAINNTRYFCYEDADIVDCEGVKVVDEEEVPQEEATEPTEETSEDTAE